MNVQSFYFMSCPEETAAQPEAQTYLSVTLRLCTNPGNVINLDVSRRCLQNVGVYSCVMWLIDHDDLCKLKHI
jgi:hypothetical protein